MNELLMKRIERKVANLSDEQGYRILDFVEFLESKYSTRERGATVLEKIADGVEDTLRATRIPVAAIRGTMGAVDAAARAMDRLAQAGRKVVDELGKAVNPPPAPGGEDEETTAAVADATGEEPAQATGEREGKTEDGAGRTAPQPDAGDAAAGDDTAEDDDGEPQAPA